ncbi:MAG: helix-turn-helix domain-containing protein [Sedimenticola sp.]
MNDNASINVFPTRGAAGDSHEIIYMLRSFDLNAKQVLYYFQSQTMPRIFNRTTNRGSTKFDILQKASHDVRANIYTIRKASSVYDIPKSTLWRHINSDVQDPVFLGRKPVLSMEQEIELCEHIKQMESVLFGLSTDDVRSLAYQFCQLNDIAHPFSEMKKKAGWDWLYGFLKRHPDLKLRTPEAVSFARATGFNKPQVQRFFNKLATILDREKLPATQIYNMDETGMNTVQKPRKVFAETGKRNVSFLTSAERGKNITAVCAMSASGNYVPPMLIFPRVRMKSELMKGAPADAVGKCSPSGYIDSQLFLEYLQHFVGHVKCSKDRTVLLILDGHKSHTNNLEAINYARDNGVVLLSLPPHTTNKLQPLDVALFKPLNTYYYEACTNFMRSNPGETITDWNVAELFNTGYVKAASMKTAVNGFKSCGIYPFNPDRFDDSDFAPASVTDRPLAPETDIQSDAGSVDPAPVQEPATGARPSTPEATATGTDVTIWLSGTVIQYILK